MKAWLILADFAETINGKLYLHGGGVVLTGPLPNLTAIAAQILVPWEDRGKLHTFRITLERGSDKQPVTVPTPVGAVAVQFEGNFSVNPVPGVPPGFGLTSSFAFNVPPLQLAPGTYEWALYVDKSSDALANLPFGVRSTPGG